MKSREKMETTMHERRFNREIERLRDPERVARMEVERVTALSLEGLNGIRTVLDVGTGSGLFAEAFAAGGLDVSGLDANPQMVAAAGSHVPAGMFYEGAAERMPFPDGSFDLVFMGLLLHETDDPLAALREARRVAVKRAAVLEWPDEEQAFGPPRDHRMPGDQLSELAREAGFICARQIRLNAMALYLLDS